MLFKWLVAPPAHNRQLRVKLPGAGTVQVDIDKHVDKALRKQPHDSARSEPGKPNTRIGR